MRTVDERLAALDSIGSLQSAEATGLLEKALHDRSPSVRIKAIETISDQGIRDTLPLVESLLSDQSERVRYNAARCVGKLLEGTGVSHEGLRSLLMDRSPLVRIQAIEGLALVSDHGSLPLLSNLLADIDPLVRAYAARSIADMNGSAHVHAIENALRTETDERARAGMIEALLLLGRREMYATFLGLLSSHDYHVRCAVANALDELPLDKSQLGRAIASLSAAHESALGVADRSTIERVLDRLRDRRMDSGGERGRTHLVGRAAL